MPPRMMVLILNWNGLADTLACLESVRRLVDYLAYEVVVVDNGSSDGSPAIIRQRFPEVMVIENEENLGYAGGNNVGLRYALAQGADYALLLNNDTEVAPDFLSRLVKAANADPIVGAAGPTILYYDSPTVIWSAGGAIDWRRGQTRMMELDEKDVGHSRAEPREVDFVSGCALLVRREVLKQVGLLDERFFLYYEEVEWCVRARQAGFRIVHVPEARIWHRISPQAQADSPLVHYYMTRNRLLFLRLTGAPWSAWVHTLGAEYLRTFLAWSLRPCWSHMGVQRKVMVRAILDAWRGRWGQQKVVG